jgi:two-component system response regulator YesN
MGCSEYVTQKRVEKAKMLLETTDKNMYTIAEAVGFDDANYFSRTYKKIKGGTPHSTRSASGHKK